MIRRCQACHARLTGRQRKYCARCAPIARIAAGSYWAGAAARTAAAGRTDWRGLPGAPEAIAAVRARATAGEPCYFHGRPGHPTCPGLINMALPGARHRWAFTVHHIQRIMHGGLAVPHPALLAPAHRGCNSRDGLYAQNQRRQARSQGVVVTQRGGPAPSTVERWTEEW